MKENEVYLVKEYNFDNLLISKIESKLDKCFKGFHNIFFHKFRYECKYDIKLTINTNNEIFISTISGKS